MPLLAQDHRPAWPIAGPTGGHQKAVWGSEALPVARMAKTFVAMIGWRGALIYALLRAKEPSPVDQECYCSLAPSSAEVTQ